ncbi:MAG TPA: DUF397 domain-containing protein, partial [Acidimicrobiales bacterium]|nr:DUF397 domain-containing protein [Acidimicrobiales bacterium]
DNTTDLHWRKSTFTDNGQCFEVAEDGDEILVRNSNRPEAGTIPFTRGELAAWVAGCKAGEFDDLA